MAILDAEDVDDTLVGAEVGGFRLARRYTEWQRFDDGGLGARFEDERGNRRIIILTPLADGSHLIDVQRM